MFEVDFAGRVLPFDRHAARNYADLAAQRRTAGRPAGELLGPRLERLRQRLLRGRDRLADARTRGQALNRGGSCKMRRL